MKEICGNFAGPDRLTVHLGRIIDHDIVLFVEGDELAWSSGVLLTVATITGQI